MEMSREQFIEEHIKGCKASRCKKYDGKRLAYRGYHSLEYSRRKCAKGIWRKAMRNAVLGK
jgi:hypothetical protein